jgi:hypothetical protein
VKRTIVILSILLVLAVGWIVWTQIRKDSALEEARQHTAAALSGARMLEASIARKDELIDHQAGTIAKLEAEQGKAEHIVGVVVAQGADFAAAFAAGVPIVDQLEAPALTEWYAATGALIPPFLSSLAGLQGIIKDQGALIGEINADNVALKTENALDKTTMADLADHVLAADAKILEAQNAGKLPETILKIGIATAIIYFGGNAVGLW